MRRLFTFATVLMVGTAMMAQNKIPFKGNVQTHQIAKEITERAASSTQKTGPNTGSTDMSTASVTKLLSLPNAYGYAIQRNQHQLTAYPSLRAVAFANRQDPNTYGGGGSGDIRYTVSTDNGDTWSNTSSVGGIINTGAATSGPARYPANILFTNGGETTSNLKLHVMAPALDPAAGTGWNSQLHCTVQDVASTGAYPSQEDYNFTATGLFSAGGNITERGHKSGEFWMVCDNVNTGDDNMYIMKGSYDATSMKMNWVIVDTLTADWNTAVDGATHHTAGAIAFSPDGTKGYVAALGDVTGGRDSAYYPVFWSFNGTDFDPAVEVNIDINPALGAYVQQWVDSANNPISPTGKVTCSFNYDLTVDSKGHPHFMTIIGPAAVDGTAYSISSGFGMREMDIHIMDDGNWYATAVGIQNAFRETLGTAPDDLAEDPQPMTARTVDGNYLFFTWTDSDTTIGTTNNSAPDIWGRMYDVNSGLFTDSVNWTLNDPNWHTKAHCAKTSEYVFEGASTSACGKSFEVPTVIINYTSPTNVLTTCEVYYFTDISYKCEDATSPADNIILAPAVSIQPALGMSDMKVYPNPTRSILNVEMKLAKQENVTISLINVNGQTVMSKVVENASAVSERLNVANLASGLYFLQVTNSKGTQAQKVVID